MGLNSDVFIAFNLQEKMAVIGGTWYGGEIKKGMFSVILLRFSQLKSQGTNPFIPFFILASIHVFHGLFSFHRRLILSNCLLKVEK